LFFGSGKGEIDSVEGKDRKKMDDRAVWTVWPIFYELYAVESMV
jgi:hypothetical protein